ncbi:MAG: threonine/serine dehydratase [Rhizomicrobium sp.]
MSLSFAISPHEIHSAAALIRGVAVRTPLLEFEALNERAGRRVLVKFEGAQRTGSFKFRGAFNRLARLDDEAKAGGVVAYSSGNHAQGVAAAARLLGIPATIVMPADAPGIKIANTRALGAEVVFYDRSTDSREQIAADLAVQRRATLVPSFDDPFVIAGQGTVGLELVEQVHDVGALLAGVFVPCGGGGLVAGVATAVKDLAPDADVYAVEPAGFDDTAMSLKSGHRETVSKGATSICDALLAPSPGELTFPILKRLLSGGLVVTDDQVRAAMKFAFEKMKLVIEPGGAVALAAALTGQGKMGTGALAVVVSGSNVDPGLYSGVIGGSAG